VVQQQWDPFMGKNPHRSAMSVEGLEMGQRRGKELINLIIM